MEEGERGSLSKSLMYKIKRSRPRMEARGTPEETRVLDKRVNSNLQVAAGKITGEPTKKMGGGPNKCRPQLVKKSQWSKGNKRPGIY